MSLSNEFLRRRILLSEDTDPYYYPDEDAQGRMGFFAPTVHLGARGEKFEASFKDALDLMWVSNFAEYNRASGALWDIQFAKMPLWHPYLSGRKVNVKNSNTPWVAGIGTLNGELPWEDPHSRMQDDEIRQKIQKWIDKNKFGSLVLLKPISDEFEHTFNTAVAGGPSQRHIVEKGFKGQYWKVASLGPVYHIELVREATTNAFLGFKLLRQHPTHAPAVKVRDPQVRMPTKTRFPSAYTRPWTHTIGGVPLTEADDPRFVYTKKLSDGRYGLMIGGERVFSTKIYVIHAGYNPARARMRM